MRYFVVLIAALLLVAVAYARPRQTPVPLQCPVAVDDTPRQGLCGDSSCPCSKCGDYCSCSESGYPCGSAGCVCPASKVAKTWTGEDGRLWTWSEDEGGYWWAYKIKQHQSVQVPTYQPYRQSSYPLNSGFQSSQANYGQPTYQPSFVPSYQPNYQGHSGAAECVGSR